MHIKHTWIKYKYERYAANYIKILSKKHFNALLSVHAIEIYMPPPPLFFVYQTISQDLKKKRHIMQNYYKMFTTKQALISY